MSHATPHPDRRDLLLAGAGLALAAGTVPAAGTQPRSTLDPADPASLFGMYRKMRFSLADGLVFWWMQGPKYGVVANGTTRLFDMHAMTILRCRPEAPDRLAVTSLEFAFYVDPATGERLAEWRNPWTDQTVQVPNLPLGPTTVRYTPAGAEMPAELPGVALAIDRPTPVVTLAGEDVWLRDDTDAVVTPRDPRLPRFRTHDWPIYHARRSDLENPALVSAPCTISFVDLSDWPGWMRMGDRPGTFLSRTIGRKESSLAAFPETSRRLLQQHYPAAYAEPAAALDKPPARFDR
jgi:hypothetical protein